MNPTPLELQQIAGYVDKGEAVPYWPSDNLRMEAIQREVNTFKGERLKLDIPRWLIAGLRALSNHKEEYVVDPWFSANVSSRSVLADLIEDTIRDFDLDPKSAQVVRTKCWLEQTDYEVFVRVRCYRQQVIELFLRHELDFAIGERVLPDVGDHADHYWSRICLAWAEDLEKQRPDRLMHGGRL